MNPDQFANTIAAIGSAGLNHSAIARETGLSRTTVWRMANRVAVEPRHSTVVRVEDLRTRVVGRTVEK